MPETINLLPKDILLLEGWNCRQTTVQFGEAVELADVMTDEQLEASIAQDGVMQPPMVRQVVVEDVTQWAAVMGFRRVRAARSMLPHSLDHGPACIHRAILRLGRTHLPRSEPRRAYHLAGPMRTVRRRQGLHMLSERC